MKYKVTVLAKEAITMGRNSETFEVSVDVTQLTKEQKDFLAENTSQYTSEGDIRLSNGKKLLDSTGNLTPESIQTAMDKEQKDINETFERAMKEAEEKIRKLENDPKYYVGSLFADTRCQKNKLSAEQNKDKEALLNRVKELKDLYAAEEKAKIEEFTAYILPLIEEFENGGERPVWNGGFIGPQSLLDRICKEDQKRSEQVKEEADNRKHAQLTEIVNQYGTDLQKRKWACDMMERREAIHLLWINTFSKSNPLPTNIWKAEDEDFKHKEGEIEKISDDEFKVYEEIIAMYPDFTAQLMREIGYDNESNEYTFECNFVRLSKKIGEYDIEADFLLS